MNDQPQTPIDPSPDDDVPSPHDTADAAANSTDAGGEPESTDERRPRVFGKYAWAVCLLPFVVYLVGTSAGSYLENVRDIARLKKKKEPVYAALQELEQYFTQLDEVKQAEWDDYLDRENFLEQLNDPEHSYTPEGLRKAAKPLYGDRPELQQKRFVRVREELEKYLAFWEALEARKHGDVAHSISKSDEDSPDDAEVNDAHALVADDVAVLEEEKSWYPQIYTGTVIATALSILLFLPLYFKAPFRISWLSIAVGVVGIVVWVGLFWLDHEFLGLGRWLNKSGRAAFNPLEELQDTPTWMYTFIAVRMIGLVLLIPIAEEFFLRGWLMRYIDDPDWDEVPLGQAGRWAIGGATIYGLVAHMTEPVSALVWFSMVTWLYLRTKSIWDCVIAHMVTNLLLGLYVLYFGQWALW